MAQLFFNSLTYIWLKVCKFL